MARKMTVIARIASLLIAYKNCMKRMDEGIARNEKDTDGYRHAVEWASKHEDAINEICKNDLPSGSGIDRGVGFDFDRSRPDKLYFNFGFHHMNDNGYYDGWTDHVIVVTPDWEGVNMNITGKDRNQIKEYLYDTFKEAFGHIDEF